MPLLLFSAAGSGTCQFPKANWQQTNDSYLPQRLRVAFSSGLAYLHRSLFWKKKLPILVGVVHCRVLGI